MFLLLSNGFAVCLWLMKNLSRRILPRCAFSSLPEPSIIHVILLNRTVRILSALGVFCMLLPIVDYFYFYSTEITEYRIDDSGICSHYPIYQIPCGGEVSDFWRSSLFLFHSAAPQRAARDEKKKWFNFKKIEKNSWRGESSVMQHNSSAKRSTRA
jgi:hypothetical protein